MISIGWFVPRLPVIRTATLWESVVLVSACGCASIFWTEADAVTFAGSPAGLPFDEFGVRNGRVGLGWGATGGAELAAMTSEGATADWTGVAVGGGGAGVAGAG